jgi:peptide/nickel transport system permease protein
MVPIFIGEIIIGICLALLAAAYKGRWPDRVLMLLAISTMSISYLVFIILGQWFLAYSLNWFPVWGWGSLINLALPLIIGIASGLGGSVRFYRTVFVNELNREYLRTAAAKGCSTFSIYTKHLLRNAMIPIITHATAALPFLFTGSLLLETFFGIPGLGYLGVEALNNSDLQLLKALVIISAILFVTINTVADVAYAWADPRIRLK